MKKKKKIKHLSFSLLLILILTQSCDCALYNASNPRNDDVLIIEIVNSSSSNITMITTMDGATHGDYELAKAIIEDRIADTIVGGVEKIFNGTLQKYSLGYNDSTKTIIFYFSIDNIPNRLSIDEVPTKYSHYLPMHFDKLTITLPKDNFFYSILPGPNLIIDESIVYEKYDWIPQIIIEFGSEHKEANIGKERVKEKLEIEYFNPQIYANKTVQELPIESYFPYGINEYSKFLIPGAYDDSNNYVAYVMYTGTDDIPGTSYKAYEVANMYKPYFVYGGQYPYNSECPDAAYYRIIHGWDPYANRESYLIIYYFDFDTQCCSYLGFKKNHENDQEPVFIWVENIGSLPYRVAYDAWTATSVHFHQVHKTYWSASGSYEIDDMETIWTQTNSYFPQGYHTFTGDGNDELRIKSIFDLSFSNNHTWLRIPNCYHTYDYDYDSPDDYTDYCSQTYTVSPLTDSFLKDTWYTNDCGHESSGSCAYDCDSNNPPCLCLKCYPGSCCIFAHDIADPFHGLFWEDPNGCEPIFPSVSVTVNSDNTACFMLYVDVTAKYNSGTYYLSGLHPDRFRLYIDGGYRTPTSVTEYSAGKYSLEFDVRGKSPNYYSYKIYVYDNLNKNSDYYSDGISIPDFDYDDDGICDEIDTDDDNDGSLDVYDCEDQNTNIYEGSISGSQICCNGAWQCTPEISSDCFNVSAMSCSSHVWNCGTYSWDKECSSACRLCGTDRKCSYLKTDFQNDGTSPGICTTQAVCYQGSCVTDTDDDGNPDSLDRDDDDDGICDNSLQGSYDSCSGQEESVICDTKEDCDSDGSDDQYDCWDTEDNKYESTLDGTQICCNGELKCLANRSSECYDTMSCINHVQTCNDKASTTQCSTACRMCGANRDCSDNYTDGADDSTSPGLCTSYNVCYYGVCYSDDDDDNIPNFMDLQVSLQEPETAIWDTDGNLTFEFNVTAIQHSTFNCTLMINSQPNQTKTGVNNNTLVNFSINNMQEGVYTWTVNCTDSSGNWDTDEPRTIGVDTQPPNITLNTPKDNTWYRSNTVQFKFILGDAVDASIDCSLYVDNVIDQTHSVSNGTQITFTKNNIPEGNHTWYLNCSDDAGWSTKSEEWLVKVDVNAPDLILNSPANDIWYNNNTVFFNFTVSDELDPLINCSLHINDILNQTNTEIPNASTTGFIVTGMPEGPHTWLIFCIDDAQNYLTTRQLINIDTLPPEQPSEIDLIANINGSVTLLWSPSTSQDVVSYTIYKSNTPSFENYTLINVSNTTTEWTDPEASNVNKTYYRVRAVDRATNEERNVVTAGKHGLMQLKPGWNVISTTYDRAQNILDNLPECSFIAKYINNGSHSGFETHIGNTPVFDFSMTPNSGYYIYCNTETEFPVIGGSVSGEAINLNSGWNLIGWSSFDNTTAEWLLNHITNAAAVGRYINNINGQQQSVLVNPLAYSIEAILAGDNVSSMFEAHVGNSPDNDFIITTGSGYFVYTTSNTTWDINMVTTTTSTTSTSIQTTSSTTSTSTTTTSTTTIPLGFIKHENNPVLENGLIGDWDYDLVFAPTVIKDGPTYKMWYTGSNGSGYQIGYATSTDGINWTKHAGNPVLTNGTSGSWDYGHVYEPVVIKDNSTYKMWYTGFNGSNERIGYAESTDGINWTKYAGNPVLSPTPGHFDGIHALFPSVIKDGSTYNMWYTGYDGSFQIGYATSANGINWSKYAGNPVLEQGSSGSWDGHYVLSPSVVKNDSTYIIFYTGENGSNYQIGYATSADGINWTKSSDNPILTPGPDDAWDNMSIEKPSVLIDNTVLKMWYSGQEGNEKIGYAYSTKGVSGSGTSIILQTQLQENSMQLSEDWNLISLPLDVK